jgi:hypothetical protein
MRTKITGSKAETIGSIRKHSVMSEIVVNTTEETQAAYDRLASPRTAGIDGMPHHNNPHACEDKLVSGIDLINSMQERYRAAQIFIAWFEPMWNALTEAERGILETYKNSDSGGEMEQYATENNISLRQAHRTRRKALEHLQSLLFGL